MSSLCWQEQLVSVRLLMLMSIPRGQIKESITCALLILHNSSEAETRHPAVSLTTKTI